MEEVDQYEFAKVQKRILKGFFLWPEEDTDDSKLSILGKFWKKFRRFFFCWSLLPTTMPLMYDVIALLIGKSPHHTKPFYNF